MNEDILPIPTCIIHSFDKLPPISNGTRDEPGITFANDLSSGWYMKDSGEIVFVAAGSESIIHGKHYTQFTSSIVLEEYDDVPTITDNRGAIFKKPGESGLWWRTKDGDINLIGCSSDLINSNTNTNTNTQSLIESIKVESGSTSKPGYSFSSDINTGINLLSNGVLSLVANSVESLRITDNSVKIFHPMEIVEVDVVDTATSNMSGKLYKKSGSTGLYWNVDGNEVNLIQDIPEQITAPNVINEITNVTEEVTREITNNITNDITNTIPISYPLLADDSTLNNPVYSFSSDNTTGMYLTATNVLGLVAGGNLSLAVTPNDSIFYNTVVVKDSQTSTPSLSTEGHIYKKIGSTGLYWNTTNGELDLTKCQFPLLGVDGSAINPTYGFINSNGTGIYKSSNGLGISVDGLSNILIGTTSTLFTKPLDISDNISSNNNSTSIGRLYKKPSTNQLIWNVNGVEVDLTMTGVVDTIRHEISDVKQEVAEVKQEILDVKQEILDVKQDVSDVKQEILDVKQEMTEVKQEILDVKQNITEVKQEMTEVKQEILDVKQEMTEVKQEMTEVKQEILDVKQDVSDVKQDVSDVKQEMTEVKQEMAEAKQEMTEVKQEMAEAKQDVSDIKQEAAEVKQALLDVKQNISDVKQEMTEVKQDVSDVKQEMTEVKQDVSDVKQNITEVKQEISDVKQNITEAKQNVSDVKQNITEAKQNITEVKQDVSDVKQTISEVKQVLDTSSVAITTLNANIGTLSNSVGTSINEVKEELHTTLLTSINTITSSINNITSLINSTIADAIYTNNTIKSIAGADIQAGDVVAYDSLSNIVYTALGGKLGDSYLNTTGASFYNISFDLPSCNKTAIFEISSVYTNNVNDIVLSVVLYDATTSLVSTDTSITLASFNTNTSYVTSIVEIDNATGWYVASIAEYNTNTILQIKFQLTYVQNCTINNLLTNTIILSNPILSMSSIYDVVIDTIVVAAYTPATSDYCIVLSSANTTNAIATSTGTIDLAITGGQIVDTDKQLHMLSLPGQVALISFGNHKTTIIVVGYNISVTHGQTIIDYESYDCADMVYDINYGLVLTVEKTITPSCFIQVIDVLGTSIQKQSSVNFKSQTMEPFSLTYSNRTGNYVLLYNNITSVVNMCLQTIFFDGDNVTFGNRFLTNNSSKYIDPDIIRKGKWLFALNGGIYNYMAVWPTNNMGVNTISSITYTDGYHGYPSGFIGLANNTVTANSELSITPKGSVYNSSVVLNTNWLGKKIYVTVTDLAFPGNLSISPINGIFLGTCLSTSKILLGL
jgi:uncharacterized coiled-coil DUF342 family protein